MKRRLNETRDPSRRISACRDFLISWMQHATAADADTVADHIQRLTEDLTRTRPGTHRHLKRRLARTRSPKRRLNACYDALLAWSTTAPSGDRLAAAERFRRLTENVARGR